MSFTVQLLSKEKCFQLLLACDLSSKRFVKHWDIHHHKMGKTNCIQIVNECNSQSENCNSDCAILNLSAILTATTQFVAVSFNDTATDDKSSGSLSRMNSGIQESGRRLTGCPPHQRWLSFSRLLRVNVASKTGSYMEFPTIP